jgi:MFS family permease
VALAALLITIVLGLTIVVIPVWLIMPFKPETARGLVLSYELRRWSPIATVVGLIAALVLVAWLWRGSRRWWRKAALVVLILPLLPAAWFARQNHFEWMFNPLRRAAYAKPSDVTFVTDTDMVMAVENNGEEVAYPVRLMAYHHVVQDVVGGTPIVATY